MKKLIIFDMDGVLVDSEKIYMEMNRAFFRELGAEITYEEYQTFIGISATKMWTYIKEKANLLQSVEELKEQEKELKHKTLKEAELVPTPGLIGLLDMLKLNGHTLAIASSGLRKNIDLILEKLGIGKYFDLIVSGEQVVKGKPEPDIFLKAAGHFQVSPSHCIVIEDSRNGVLAAKAAGMYCIGYNNPSSGNQDLSKADIIIDSLGSERFYEILKEASSARVL